MKKIKNILQLSFSPEIFWGYQILNCFSDEMKDLYKNGFVRELMFSITQKMELFSYIIPKLNQRLGNMRAVLRTRFRRHQRMFG